MSKKFSTTLLLIIIALGTALRAYHLTARSLWFDEAFSWRLIQFNWGEMIARAAIDVHPPLYYLLLKAWSLIFATSLLSLRSFSVVFAALTILLIYCFAAYAFRSRPIGLIAAALVAISGFQIQYAWEARMYTLGAAFAILSSWLLLIAIRQKPSRLFWWLAYGVSASAFFYIHYFAAFTLAAHAVFIILYLLFSTRGRLGEILQWPLTWHAVASAGVAILLYLPWLKIFIVQNQQVQESYWIPSIGGWSVPDTFYRLFLPTSGIPAHLGMVNIILALLPIALTIAGWVWVMRLYRRDNQHSVAAGLVVTGGTMPFIITILISLFSQSLYQDRYFIFSHLFIIIALAALLWKIKPLWLRLILTTLVLIGISTTTLNYWVELDIPARPGARAAAREVYATLAPSEAVLVSSPFVFFAIDHYAVEEHGVYRPLREKPLAAPRLYSETGELSHFSGGPILLPSDITGPEIFDRQDLAAIWVVDTTGFGSTALQPPSDWRPESTLSFPEVFGYQGEVSVTKYAR